MKLMSKVRSRATKRVLAVIAGAMVFLGITVVPAFAHTPGLTAQANCDGTVSFTSISWTTGPSGTNPQIDVKIQYGGKSTTVATGSYSADNNYRFSGSFVAPSPYPAKGLWVYAVAVKDWADGRAGGSGSGVKVIPPPTGCTNSTPSASISHDCTSYTAALDNTASTVAVDFVVTVNGTATTYNVGPGLSRDVTGDVTEGTSYAITVTAGGKQLDSSSFTVDCQKPAATVTHDCDQITAVLKNTDSTVAVEFTFTVGNDVVKRTVGAGDTVTLTHPVTPETAYAISVSAGGATLATDSISATDCTTAPPVVEPTATVTHTCDTITAVLDNTGSTVDVEFTFTVGDDVVTRTVGAGDTLTLTHPVVPETAYAISVTADGTKLATDSITDKECTSGNVIEPTATVTHDCDLITATLDNKASNVQVTFTVTINGTDKTYDVDAGATRTVTSPVEPETAYDVTVSANDTDLATDSIADNECSTAPPGASPTAEITHTCTSYTATLDNTDSTVDVEFIVTVNDVETSVTVPAGKTDTSTGPVTEDGDYTITVSAYGTELDTSTFTVDCTVVSPPGVHTATITHDCEEYTVTLRNTDEASTTFTVTVNGVDTDVDVPGGSTRTQTRPVAEDATYTISVSDSEGTLVSTTFDVDCLVVSPPTDATASITHDCDTWSVGLDNSDGTDAVEYTIVVRSETDNGASSTTSNVTVGAGDTDSTGGSVVEDTSYRIVVRAGDTRVARDSFTVNCTKVSPPGGGTSSGTTSTGSSSALPDTGSTVRPGLIVLGAGLLSAGALALFLGLGRRRSATR